MNSICRFKRLLPSADNILTHHVGSAKRNLAGLCHSRIADSQVHAVDHANKRSCKSSRNLTIAISQSKKCRRSVRKL